MIRNASALAATGSVERTKASHIISKTFNDYDNDYYTCNKISKHFHNQTHARTLVHTFTQSQLSFLSDCCQLELQCDQAHTHTHFCVLAMY